MYDAIVVGARAAGSPTAMLLARQGLRVLLLERAAFPSDTLSTHYIHQPGVAALERWGLLQRLIDSGCPPSTTWTFDVGPLALTGFPSPKAARHPDYCPRRTVLDAQLAQAAAAAGAELRQGFAVQELVWDGEQVVGIRGHAAGGPTTVERARIVIGADGLHSLVARSVQAPSYEVRPSLTCAYYTYFEDVPCTGLELYPRPGNAIIVVPTHQHQTCIAVQWPVQAFDRVRADVSGAFDAAIDRWAPTLAERVRSGRRAERFLGTADLPFLYRQASGPGWALVGDAGSHQDPGTGHGISNAFRDAELLADAVARASGGALPLAAALAQYQRDRDQRSRPLYDYTWKIANLAPPAPEEQALIGALAGNQAETDHFFGALAGTLPLDEFFDAANLGRIMAGAPVASVA